MTSAPASIQAEARLIDRIWEIDPDDDDLAGAESWRAVTFRALQRNWDRYPADDVRWGAAQALIVSGDRDQALVDEAMLACAEVVDLLAGAASKHNCADPEKMAQLDQRMKELADMVERVREHQGTVETWAEVIERFTGDGKAAR